MSSFSNKGKRADVTKKVHKHQKEFFSLIERLKELGEQINDTWPNIDINSKKAIANKAKEITGRELDSLEIIVVINNIRNLRVNEQKETGNNNK
jgi:hypothetical protein